MSRVFEKQENKNYIHRNEITGEGEGGRGVIYRR